MQRQQIRQNRQHTPASAISKESRKKRTKSQAPAQVKDMSAGSTEMPCEPTTGKAAPSKRLRCKSKPVDADSKEADPLVMASMRARRQRRESEQSMQRRHQLGNRRTKPESQRLRNRQARKTRES